MTGAQSQVLMARSSSRSDRLQKTNLFLVPDGWIDSKYFSRICFHKEVEMQVETKIRLSWHSLLDHKCCFKICGFQKKVGGFNCGVSHIFNAGQDIIQDKVHQTIGKAYSRMMSSKVKLASRLQIEIEEMLILNSSARHE